MNKWLCGLLLHCRLWPLHTIPCTSTYITNVTHIVDRKWVWTENDFNLGAKLCFAGLPTLWRRKRNKVGCQQESQVKAPGGGEKFFFLVKVGTAFVFVLFVILIFRRRNWAKTTNRTKTACKCKKDVINGKAGDINMGFEITFDVQTDIENRLGKGKQLFPRTMIYR